MMTIFNELNDMQKRAVLTDKKKLLILAGAGTGKTKVITSKIIYLIKEKNVDPFNIFAVTFTNKASNEMKERVLKHFNANFDLMIKTFHSFGAYLLRNEPYLAGRNRFFQIYDSDDSSRVLTKVLKKFELPGNKTGLISKWIQEYKQKIEDYSSMSYKDSSYVDIYDEYNKSVRESNCFDFEDLILEPIKFFINILKY